GLRHIGAEHDDRRDADEPEVRVVKRPAGVREVPHHERNDDHGGGDEQDVEEALQREQLPVYRQRGPHVVAEFSDGGRIRSEIPPSARVSSLGITQTLFASPCAICGSTCRYW